MMRRFRCIPLEPHASMVLLLGACFVGGLLLLISLLGALCTSRNRRHRAAAIHPYPLTNAATNGLTTHGRPAAVRSTAFRTTADHGVQARGASHCQACTPPSPHTLFHRERSPATRPRSRCSASRSQPQRT